LFERLANREDDENNENNEDLNYFSNGEGEH